ncbi:unnamed protein product, partial [Microthlaspi erraticum]
MVSVNLGPCWWKNVDRPISPRGSYNSRNKKLRRMRALLIPRPIAVRSSNTNIIG